MYFVVAGFLHLSLSQFLCQLIHDESSINTDVVRDSTYVEYKHELCCVGILILDKWSRYVLGPEDQALWLYVQGQVHF